MQPAHGWLLFERMKRNGMMNFWRIQIARVRRKTALIIVKYRLHLKEEKSILYLLQHFVKISFLLFLQVFDV